MKKEKWFNSFRFQFAVVFFFFSFVLILTTTFRGIWQLSSAVEKTFANQGIYIAERAASLVDGDLFEVLLKSADNIDPFSDPFYEETRINLQDLKDASGCMYLYTMAPYRDDIWFFVIDGSDDPGGEDFSDFGDQEDALEYDDAFLRSYNYGKTEVSHLAYQDGWGWLISIYTPIRNSRGTIVGLVGCDFDGSHLRELIIAERMQKAGIGVIFIIIGIVISMFLDKRIKKENKKTASFAMQGLQNVLDAAPMICGIFDKDGNFISVNKFVETMYDIPDKQIYVDRFEEFLPKYQPDGQESFQKSCDVIRKAFDEGEARYEWTYQKQDGTPIETEEIGRRVRFGNRDVVVCYTIDMREQKKITQGPRTSPARNAGCNGCGSHDLRCF
jgi:PAS domain-containing protein